MFRFLSHILLSLLLLGSQQMVVQHGFTHWESVRKASAAQADQGTPGKPVKPVLHELCPECQANGHLTFALPSAAYYFTLLDVDAGPLAARCAEGILPHVLRLFQPRAPPSSI